MHSTMADAPAIRDHGHHNCQQLQQWGKRKRRRERSNEATVARVPPLWPGYADRLDRWANGMSNLRRPEITLCATKVTGHRTPTPTTTERRHKDGNLLLLLALELRR